MIAFKYNYAGQKTLENKVGQQGEKYWEYEYDLLDRLSSVKENGVIVAEYEYNSEGLRLKKETADKTTYYLFGLNGEILFEQEDSQYMEYIYVGSKHFARVDGNTVTGVSETYFYHTDNLGSTVLVTNTVAEIVWSSEYTPFGKITMEEGLLDRAIKFTGKDLDEDTGLYYYNARWYDAEVGRFTSADTYKGELENPQTLNLYVYVQNNPLRYVDPTGNIPVDDEYGIWNESDVTEKTMKNIYNDGWSDVNTEAVITNSSGIDHEQLFRDLLTLDYPYPAAGFNYNKAEGLEERAIKNLGSVGGLNGTLFQEIFSTMAVQFLDNKEQLNKQGAVPPEQRQKLINQTFYEWNKRFTNPYTKFLAFNVDTYIYNIEKAVLENTVNLSAETLIGGGLALTDIKAFGGAPIASTLLQPRFRRYEKDDLITKLNLMYSYKNYAPEGGILEISSFSNNWFTKGLTEGKGFNYFMSLELQIRDKNVIDAAWYWELISPEAFIKPTPQNISTYSDLK